MDERLTIVVQQPRLTITFPGAGAVAGEGAVASVDGRTGVVTLSDRYDALGAASSAVAAHVAAADPHPAYLLESAAAGLYQPLGSYLTSADLSPYLTTAAAASTYQPIGAYLVASDLAPYLTSATAASTYQPVGSYLTTSAAAAAYQPLDGDLTALAALSTSGHPRRTGVDTWVVDATGATGLALLATATAADARSALGLVIGTDVQAVDAELAAIAGLTSAADRLPYFTGSGTASLATFTSYGRSLVDDADAAAARATLGLGAGALDSGWTYQALGSDVSDSTGSLVASGLAFTPSASVTYLVEAFLVFQSAATATGLQWSFSAPTGATWATQSLNVPTAVNASVVRNGSLDSAALGTGVSSTAVQYLALGTSVLRMGASPGGTVRVVFQTEVPASAVTLLAGSFIRYRTIP